MDSAVQNFQNCDYIQPRCKQAPLSRIVALMLSDARLQNLSLVILVFKYIRGLFGTEITKLCCTLAVLDPNGEPLACLNVPEIKNRRPFKQNMCMNRRVAQLGIRNSSCFLHFLRFSCLPDLS